MGSALRVALRESRPPAIALTFLAVLIGGLLAWRLGYDLRAPQLLAGALGAALINWADHPLDTLVDFYWRNEYALGYRSRFGDSAPLLASGLAGRRDLIEASAALFLLGGALVAYAVSLSPAPGWAALFASLGTSLSLAYAAGGLDRAPVAGDLAFAAGALSALLGGYFLVASSWTPAIAAVAGLLFLAILALKIVDSLPDRHDALQGKRTIPVLIGYGRARALAYGLLYSFSASLAALWAAGALPWPALASALVPLPTWVYAQVGLDDHRAEVAVASGVIASAIPLLLYLALA